MWVFLSLPVWPERCFLSPPPAICLQLLKWRSAAAATSFKVGLQCSLDHFVTPLMLLAQPKRWKLKLCTLSCQTVKLSDQRELLISFLSLFPLTAVQAVWVAQRSSSHVYSNNMAQSKPHLQILPYNPFQFYGLVHWNLAKKNLNHI